MSSVTTEHPSYQDYLARDSRPVPASLRSRSTQDLGSAPLDAARYTSARFFDLECERLWPRVWQMVCRQEELAKAGDAVIYDIVGRSFIVVRTESGAIRAHYNSCLHRGRKLLDADGKVSQLRCGFHGISWSLEGDLRSRPCNWDFPDEPSSAWRLPRARIALWGGFVFLNMDPHAPSLEEYLEVLPEHFSRWRLEDCYKAAHVAKVIPCNWKLAQEAFMESYHVIATHPQILPVIADANSQYDVFGDHVNRNMAAFGAPSPHLGSPGTFPPERTFDGMMELWQRQPSVCPNLSAGPRAGLGALARQAFGKDLEHEACDAELLDAIVYNVFPNFAPWGGFAPNIVYRWRPDGRKVDSCVMEVILLKRAPKNAARPPPVPIHWLKDTESWSTATELPILGPVIDQDMGNLPQVQQGLLASATGEVRLSRYHESRIRHFHRTLDKYLSQPQVPVSRKESIASTGITAS